MATTNLPPITKEDSAAATKLFFDSYGQQPLEFLSTDVDSTVAFFTSRGFDTDAALVVSTVILKQAKIDNTPVYKLLDTLSTFGNLELSQLVGEVLNNNRTPISTLGFRTTNVIPVQSRNIAP